MQRISLTGLLEDMHLRHKTPQSPTMMRLLLLAHINGSLLQRLPVRHHVLITQYNFSSVVSHGLFLFDVTASPQVESHHPAI